MRRRMCNLQLEYLDLYLMHWPVALKPGVPFPKSADDMVSLKELPVETTWAAMEALVDNNLTRQIGVSNFSVKKAAGPDRQGPLQTGHEPD